METNPFVQDTIAGGYSDPALRVGQLRRLWHRFRRTSPYSHARVIRHALTGTPRGCCNQSKPADGKTVFILRVDDFPRWDRPIERFCGFDAILRASKIPYCLGVTPYLADDPLDPTSSSRPRLTGNAAAILRHIYRRGNVEIAMHGLTHRTAGRHIRNEFEGMPADAFEKALRVGLAAFDQLEINCRAFIPPFNAVGFAQIPAIARRFRVLFGGPESVALLGFRTSPSLLNGMLYLPSYYPAYGRAHELVAFVQKLKQSPRFLLVPLTLHWAWEEDDNFQGLKMLSEQIAGRTISLGSLIAICGGCHRVPAGAFSEPQARLKYPA